MNMKSTMKVINHADFEQTTAFLSNRKHGSFRLDGRLELYSCDKLISSSSHNFSSSSSSSSLLKDNSFKNEDLLTARRPRASTFDTSPIRKARPRGGSLGSFDEVSSQVLLLTLIEVLNESFLDYNFNATKAEQFIARTQKICMDEVNDKLSFVKDEDAQFLNKLWGSVNEAITLRECEIFSYEPDMNDDPFSEGTIWQFNFFIFNKAKGRICYFACIAKRNDMEESFDDRTDDCPDTDEDEDEDEEEDVSIRLHRFHSNQIEGEDDDDEEETKDFEGVI